MTPEIAHVHATILSTTARMFQSTVRSRSVDADSSLSSCIYWIRDKFITLEQPCINWPQGAELICWEDLDDSFSYSMILSNSMLGVKGGREAEKRQGSRERGQIQEVPYAIRMRQKSKDSETKNKYRCYW